MTQQYEYRLMKKPAPPTFPDITTPVIPDAVMHQRLANVISAMSAQGLEFLVIYADKEHGGNFEYLSGFIPRFEEALLVISAEGTLSYIMGNENLKLVPFARNAGNCLHAPIFSLPNQPMDGDQPLHTLLARCGITASSRTGIVGWKLFTGLSASNQLFDVPAFVADAVFQACGGKHNVINATGLFISPESGVRIHNSAAEVAFYEYGANLASTCLLSALDAIEVGKSEKSIGQLLAAAGQPSTVISIAATGDRFSHATLYPRDKLIALGDKFSLTVGYKGGLSSRAAYVVAAAEELPAAVADYLPRVAQPYYHAVVTWLESLRCGLTGGELYQIVEHVLPKERWHWHLNPGHLVADEEWLCSPVSSGSKALLGSGMLLQIDIIPSVKGYGGCSIEDTVALADTQLQAEIALAWPDVWQRMQARRQYVEQVLHIQLHQDVLLLSNTVGYLRPYLLSKSEALVKVAN
ncbi:aminopeptidase P family protein [Pantoea cypripedii]|uniref:Xaa-Pro aminopeptidase n=1 Tax=Pantoea cypripedii TaxID=55209 RepID=A0A6B9G5Q5_PANCY|nr:aminopeptidase P family protein [Pantoea cypripedii]QGY32398.1 Xaa-Pro aminopeptidase [Pantoea cypripedii]